MQKNLIIIGDAIEDIYCEKSTNDNFKNSIVPGGALNTFFNAKSMLSLKKTNIFFIPSLISTDKPLYKILRLNKNEDIHLIPPSKKTYYYADYKYSITRELNLILEKSNYNSTIVFSDYNKGTINHQIPRYKGVSRVHLGIIDSKYNSLHSSLFDYCDNFIYRCTGKEYDSNFAKKCNYTIWTNGSKKIKFLSKDQKIIKEFTVPQIEAIDSCGAGDTFTAAIAVYLHENIFNVNNIEKAINFAITASINVIKKEKTAITDIKI